MMSIFNHLFHVSFEYTIPKVSLVFFFSRYESCLTRVLVRNGGRCVTGASREPEESTRLWELRPAQNVLRFLTAEDFRALELHRPWRLLKDKALAIRIHGVPPEGLTQPCRPCDFERPGQLWMELDGSRKNRCRWLRTWGLLHDMMRGYYTEIHKNDIRMGL